jgi:hypothetical protein
MSDQTVHVFITPTLPGCIRIGREEINLKFENDAFMFSKLFAIVASDRM